MFVDGCFWHGCPKHLRIPQTHEDYWSEKIGSNVTRDRNTNLRLQEAGWLALRIWEHEDPLDSADRVVEVVKARKPS